MRGVLPRELSRYSKENILRSILASAALGPLSGIEKNVNMYNVILGIFRGVEKPMKIERIKFGFKNMKVSDLTLEDHSPYSEQSVQYRRMLVHWGLNNEPISSFDPKGKLQHLMDSIYELLPIHFDIEMVYGLFQQNGALNIMVVLRYYGVPDIMITEMLAVVIALDLQMGDDKYAVDMGVYSSQAAQIGVTDSILDAIFLKKNKK